MFLAGYQSWRCHNSSRAVFQVFGHNVKLVGRGGSRSGIGDPCLHL